MLSSASVLIVEDDPGIRTALDALLDSYSVPTLWAESGAHAARLLDQLESPPKLVIVDGQLPDGHGLDLIRSLRARLPDETEIFLFSAEARPENDWYGKSGADGFLRKPFDIERLIDLAARHAV